MVTDLPTEAYIPIHLQEHMPIPIGVFTMPFTIPERILPMPRVHGVLLPATNGTIFCSTAIQLLEYVMQKRQ